MILHWVPQLQVQMHLMKPTTISIMGSYTSGNMFISSCLLLKNFIYSNLIWSSVLVCEFATHGQIYIGVLWQNLFQAICLEAFVVIILNKIFSGRQPYQTVNMFHSFRDWLFLCWDDDDDVYRVSSWNFGSSWHFDVAVCLIRFYWTVSSSSSRARNCVCILHLHMRCDKKLQQMLLPSAIQRKGRDLQYEKWRIEP